jgi:NAD-dependent DNA ligase
MISKLKEKIIKANEAYRIGDPIISDVEYDILIDQLMELSPNDELLTKIGHKITDETRKINLPIEMASMNKIKSMDDIYNWCRLKGISQSEHIIITPKFDGVSLCVDEDTNEAITRGDGVIGQRSNEHYSLIQNHINTREDIFKYTYGEVIMPKKVFIDKYSTEFSNPRNLVAGLLNSKEPTDILKDCQYIKYGAITKKNFNTKEEILIELNKAQLVKVQFYVCKISDITEDLLIQLFGKYSTDYEIDGLILEINNISLQEKLGRETSTNNPCWARAFKHPSFEQTTESDVIGISWNISKQGYLKPIIHINPVKLDGVIISNVTGNNARFIKDMGIGVGSKIKIVRSGMVIPKVIDVIKTVDFKMPDIDNIDWNENGIELVTLFETDDQKLKKIIAFFEILETDNVSIGVITQLWNAGYKTIKDILNLTKEDLEKLDGFGKRKSTIVFNSIQKSINDVQLSKLQHATGIFKGLGSKKLALLEHFTEKPTINDVIKIEGFAEISAKTYVDNYDRFFEFIKELPISISKKEKTDKISDDLKGKVFVFTGVRRPDLVKIIESRGGKEGSSVSKNTTHLVCVDKNSKSSKMTKAINLGIEILDVKDLENILSS